MGKNKFVIKRNLSFHYLSENHVENYRRIVREYLRNLSDEIEKMGEPYLIVDSYGFEPRIKNNITEQIFIYDVEDNLNRFEQVCKHILSKDRRFIPIEVACSNKEDYGMIEKILKENYGEKGKLTNGFLGLSKLNGMRSIKRE
jgi:hypothetical protein